MQKRLNHRDRGGRTIPHVATTTLVRNPMTDRVICGWRVRSKLPLPETAPWRGLPRAVDITIDVGRLPAPVGKVAGDLPFIEAGPEGGLMVNATPVARFLVTPNSVIVDSLAFGRRFRLACVTPRPRSRCIMLFSRFFAASRQRATHRGANRRHRGCITRWEINPCGRAYPPGARFRHRRYLCHDVLGTGHFRATELSSAQAFTR